jgi:hypothetical protein
MQAADITYGSFSNFVGPALICFFLFFIFDCGYVCERDIEKVIRSASKFYAPRSSRSSLIDHYDNQTLIVSFKARLADVIT